MMECERSITDEMFAAVREGNIEMVTKIIEKYGLSYSSDWKEGYKLLWSALENRNLEIAKLLINCGCAVNKECESSILDFCILHEDDEILKMILKRGANINISFPLKNELRWRQVIEILLQYGADIDAEYSFHGTLLHQAVDKERLKNIEFLLNRGANINSVGTWFTEKGITPLHIAVKNDCKKIVKLLLRKGADVNFTAQNKSTPLLIAIKNKNETLVKLLLQRGAEIEPQEIVPNTALIEAVKCKHLGIVKQILQYSPDINNQCNKCCLRIAMMGRYNKYIVDSLLEYGFFVHRKVANDAELLLQSVKNGHSRVIEDLLRYGANINVLFSGGYTLLHHATRYEQKKAVELLIKYGANINAKATNGETPINIALQTEFLEVFNIFQNLKASKENLTDFLCLAVEARNKEIIETLLQSKFDINASSSGGFKALHYTAPNAYTCDSDESGAEIAKLLITKGADVNAQDRRYGRTTLHHACINEFPKLVKTLLYYGADINIRDYSGHTPAEVAFEKFDYVYDEISNLYDPEENSFSSNKLLNIVACHVTQMEEANFYLHDRIFLKMDRTCAMYNNFKNECKQEIAEMKRKTFKNSSISLYEILTNNTETLAKYMNQENIVEELKSNDYKSEFPIYARMIEINFLKGMNRKILFDEAKYNFYFVFEPFNDECANKILDLLCASDLQNFKNAFSLSHSL